MTDTQTLTPGYHELPLTMLVPSTQNPRKTLGDVTDLAASIREVGILEPILVRPRDGAAEVVAGSRRYAAAQAAGLLIVPCLVRELTDAQALELAIVENNQRGDIHPLDEAEAFETLTTMNRLYTPEVIAAKIGRPRAYVVGRLRLLNLVPAVREDFAADRITIGHAERIARLKPELQERALRACFFELFDDDDEADSTFQLKSVAQLDAWVRQHVVIDLADPLVQETLPELAESVSRVEGAGGTVLRLSDEWHVELDDANGPAPLPRSKWVEILADPCAHAQPGVIVYGSSKQPTMLMVCIKDSACPTHWPAPVKAAKGQKARKTAWQKEEERRAEARKVFDAQLPDLLADLAAHVATMPVNAALVHLLVQEYSVQKLTPVLGELTDQNAGAYLWMAGALNQRTYNPDDFSAAVQDATGFDVAAWRDAHAPAAPEAPKKAAKRQKARK